MNVARGCRMREMQNSGAAPGAAPGTAPTSTRQGAAPAGGAPRPGITQGTGNGTRQGAGRGRAATRLGLVFVQKPDSTWEARMVRLGVADYDFTEVVSGLEEGDRVALLSAAALQMQRQENQDRMRQMQGGGSPLGGGTGGGAARPAGGAPAGGGGRP
jgi:HlyD family secretion protein